MCQWLLVPKDAWPHYRRTSWQIKNMEPRYHCIGTTLSSAPFDSWHDQFSTKIFITNYERCGGNWAITIYTFCPTEHNVYLRKAGCHKSKPYNGSCLNNRMHIAIRYRRLNVFSTHRFEVTNSTMQTQILIWVTDIQKKNKSLPW